jgi:hypothetical protein
VRGTAEPTGGGPATPQRPNGGRLVDDVLVGGTAGVTATVVMSVLMLGGQRLGVLPGQPPERLVEAVLDAAHASRTERSENALASVAHLGFGAACGVLYRLLRGRLPVRGRGWLQGAAYGLGVWFVSYQGWIPAFGVLPPPRRDVPGRPATMVAAHIVYGSVLGLLADRRRASAA